jgi:hypothetical protein
MFKEISFFIVLFITTSVFSQQSKLDKYQYIIVPDKFDFVRSTDQYKTSSLTKFLLSKKGFKVFLSSEKLPQELQKNRCTALMVNIKDESSMFTTKSTIIIQDCHGKVLYTSKIGKSKEKSFQKGYQESIRNAYASMNDFEYSFTPPIVVMKEEKKEVTLTKKTPNKLVVPITTVQEVVVTPEVKKEVETIRIKVSNAINVLYAQPINNGFQLINTKPEVIFSILNTNLKNVFMLKDRNGIFYKIGENWVSEFYENNQLIQKEFQVRF